MRFAATVAAGTRTGAYLHVVGVFKGIPFARSRQVAERIADGLGSEQHGQVVLVGKGLVVVGGIGPGPGIALTVYTRHAVYIAGIHRTAERVVEVLAVLDTDIGLEREALDGFQLEVGITQDTPRRVVVVLGILDELHGVGQVRSNQLQRTGPRTVKTAHGQCRVLAHGRERHTPVAGNIDTPVFPVGQHEVLAHRDILVEVVSRVDTGRVALVEGLPDVTVLVDVVERKHHRTLVGIVRDRGGEVVGPGRAVYLVLPVGIGGRIVGIAGHVGLQHRSLAVAIEHMRGGYVRVFRSSPVGYAPLVGIEHFVAVGNRLDVGRVVYVDRHAVALALLGGDDYHAVGGTRTVDRGRCSILQHLHGLDVARVDAVDVVGRHTVDDVEGVVARVGRRHTPDTNRTGTAGSGIGHYVHTRQPAGHGAHDVTGVLAQRLLHVHDRDRPGKVGFTNDLIAHDHHVVEHFGIFAQMDGHLRRGFGLGRIESNVRKLQGCTFRDGDGKVPVNVGRGSGLGRLTKHGGSNERLSAGL